MSIRLKNLKKIKEWLRSEKTDLDEMLEEIARFASGNILYQFEFEGNFYEVFGSEQDGLDLESIEEVM